MLLISNRNGLIIFAINYSFNTTAAIFHCTLSENNFDHYLETQSLRQRESHMHNCVHIHHTTKISIVFNAISLYSVMVPSIHSAIIDGKINGQQATYHYRRRRQRFKVRLDFANGTAVVHASSSFMQQLITPLALDPLSLHIMNVPKSGSHAKH